MQRNTQDLSPATDPHHRFPAIFLELYVFSLMCSLVSTGRSAGALQTPSYPSGFWWIADATCKSYPSLPIAEMHGTAARDHSLCGISILASISWCDDVAAQLGIILLISGKEWGGGRFIRLTVKSISPKDFYFYTKLMTPPLYETGLIWRKCNSDEISLYTHACMVMSHKHELLDKGQLYNTIQCTNCTVGGHTNRHSLTKPRCLVWSLLLMHAHN